MGSVRIESAGFHHGTQFRAVACDGIMSAEALLRAVCVTTDAPGILTFTPDGEEADAARGEERVVGMRYEAGGWRLNGYLVSPDVAHLVFGLCGSGSDYILCGPLPDAPKPVAVWERPPREGGWVYGYICSACGAPLQESDLGGECSMCHKPLAATLTLWPGKGESNG